MEFRQWALTEEAVALEALEEVEAEEVAEVMEALEVTRAVPAEVVDRAGIQAVAAVEGADSIRRVVAGRAVAGRVVAGKAAAGRAAAGIADIPEGDNLEVGRAWAGPAPSSSWHAPPLPLST